MVPPTEEKPKRLLRTSDACIYLSLNRRALTDLVLRGEIKAIRRRGKHASRLFDIKELDRWIDKNSVARLTPSRY